MGRRLDELQIVEGKGLIKVDAPDAIKGFDRSAGAVPFDVSGVVAEEARDLKGNYIAVAVNGTVRAVTRTWSSRTGRWLTTPPLDAWHEGENDLQIFLISTPQGTPLLRRAFHMTPRPADLNLVSGLAAQLYGVKQQGLYRHEVGRSGPFRWTDGSATLVTSIDPRRPPQAISIALATAGTGGKTLKVTVNGCAVFEGVVPAKPWTTDLNLGACAIGGSEVTIALMSSVREPVRGDSRRLGVAVQSVMLH